MSQKWDALLDKQQKIFPISFCMSVILASMLAVCFAYFSCFRVYTARLEGDHPITAIIQTGPIKEALPTEYLAELLNLSSDRPPLFLEFDERQGIASLLGSAMIKSAMIKKLPPSTLYIDYTLYEPIARIFDYENLVVDESGHFFPFRPFFSPRELPEIYLGIKENKEGEAGLKKAFEVLEAMTKRFYLTRLKIKRVDVSHLFYPSLGQQEIVAIVIDDMFSSNERFSFEYILRLNVKEYEKNLLHFSALRRELIKEQEKYIADYFQNKYSSSKNTKIIDLRIDKMAYITQMEK